MQDPLRGYSVVLLGAMNPLIHSPEWLRRHRVLDDRLVDNALRSGQTLLTPVWAQVPLGEYILMLDQQRWEMQTARFASSEPIRSAFARTFRILAETPATALGLNFWAHRVLTGVEATGGGSPSAAYLRAALLRLPAALGPVPGLEAEPVAVVLKHRLEDRLVTARFEPSNLRGDAVFVNCNFHYELAAGGPSQVVRAVEIAEARWDADEAAFEQILESVATLPLADESPEG